MSLLTEVAMFSLEKWKIIVIVGVFAAAGGYIAHLHHAINVAQEEAVKSHDALVKAKAEYDASVTQLSATVKMQNDAIAKYNVGVEHAKDTVVAANTAATEARATADEQVREILKKTKTMTCEGAIKFLVDSIPDLQWSQIK